MLSLKNDVNEPSKSNKQKTEEKKLFFVGVLKGTYEKSWIRIRNTGLNYFQPDTVKENPCYPLPT
jgi:hypothetical protein